MKKNRFINNIVGHRLSLFAFAIATLFFVTSCEEDLLVFDTPDGFAQLGTPASREVSESSGQTINTIIQLGKPNPNGQEVSVSVAGDASRFTIVPQISGTGTVNIPAGETTFVIAVTPVNNFDSDGNADITISLVDGDIPVGIGGEGNFRTQNVITIVDDDCPFDINDFTGSYNVEIVSQVGFGNPAGSYFSTTTLSLGEEPNTLIDSNFWDFGSPAVITFDPSDPSNYTVELVGEPQFVYFNASGLARFAIQGIMPLGSFSTCTQSFQVNMELTREDGVTVANRSEIFYTR
jgi:hypothetical protein